MHFIWLLEVRGHFRQQLIGGNSHIYCKSKLLINLVLYLTSCCYGIRVDQGSSSHVQKYLINRKGFHCRSIRFTNCFKCLGILRVKAKITRYHYQIRAFSKGHCHGLTSLYSVFLGRNGFRNYDSGTCPGITAHCRRNFPQIRLTCLYSARCLPGKKSAVHINMKNQSFHLILLLSYFPLFPKIL